MQNLKRTLYDFFDAALNKLSKLKPNNNIQKEKFISYIHTYIYALFILALHIGQAPENSKINLLLSCVFSNIFVTLIYIILGQIKEYRFNFLCKYL